MIKCPICQHEAYIGFNAIECSNSACEHYKAPRRNLGDVRDGDEELKIVAAPATPGWNHWLSSAKKTHKEICRWTMKAIEGDKCRYIGWIDEHGNRNVALDDAFCKTQRQRWVIQPPVGQMEFGFKNVGEPFELSPAMKTVPGSEKVEDHFVIPETMTAKVVPSYFEAMWQIAKPIQNCEEYTHLIGHYEKYKGA